MDKRQKKALLHEVRNSQRAVARAAFPLPPAELKAMFDMFDAELPLRGCDHTRRLTKSWLEARGHDVEVVFAWLDGNGGYCDCEALMNAEQKFEDAMHDSSDE